MHKVIDKGTEVKKKRFKKVFKKDKRNDNTSFLANKYIFRDKFDEELIKKEIQKIILIIRTLSNYSYFDLNVSQISSITSFKFFINQLSLDFDQFITLFPLEIIQTIFEVLYYTNEKDRKVLEGLLELIISKYGKYTDLFLFLIANFIMSNRNQKNSQDAVSLSIKLFSILLNKNKKKELCEFFCQFIVPELNNFDVNEIEDFHKVMCYIGEIDIFSLKKTLKFFLESFNKKGVMLQISTLKVVFQVVTQCSGLCVKEIIDEVLDFFIKGFSSENYQVLDCILDSMLYGQLTKFFNREINVILPKIFESLYKASKKFWKLEQRVKVIKAVGYLIEKEPDLFEECLIEYNQNKQRNRK